MTDWEGLLKWSLNYQDGTKPTQIDSLTDEQRQFIQDAIQSYTFDEVKRMQDIVKQLESTIDNEEEVTNNLELLDELLNVLTGIDNAKNFCKIGGIYFIFRMALSQDIDKRLRNVAFVILVDCSQNNEFVQKFLQRIKFWNLIRVWEEGDWMLRLRSMGAIGAMIKGNNLIMKRDFIENKGFNYLIKYFKEALENEEQDEKENALKHKTLAKMVSILDDLLKFEKFLDRNIDYLENETDYEQIPRENKFSKFTCYSYPQAMTIARIVENLCQQNLSSLEYKESNNRVVLIRCIKSFWRETQRQKSLNFSHFKNIRKYLTHYQKELGKVVQTDDFYENELEQVKQVLDSFRDDQLIF